MKKLVDLIGLSIYSFDDGQKYKALYEDENGRLKEIRAGNRISLLLLLVRRKRISTMHFSYLIDEFIQKKHIKEENKIHYANFVNDPVFQVKIKGHWVGE